MSAAAWPQADSVERAIADLRERSGSWPTVTAIANHLQCDADSVRDLLLQLRRDRKVTVRRRSGSRVWMPWGEM